MTLPHTTRRHVTFAIVLVWLLVCSGLAWATHSVIQLERKESRDAAEKAYRQRRMHALYRLHDVVAPILWLESGRPYEYFSYEYKPAEARDQRTLRDVSKTTLIPSPLQNGPFTDWILMHFMVSESDRWRSPQVSLFDGSAVSAIAMDPQERARLALPANWLTTLRDSYTHASLEAALDSATAENIARRSSERLRGSGSAAAESSIPKDVIIEDAPQGPVRRLQRLLEIYPPEVCVSSNVLLENLDIAPGAHNVEVDTSGCIQVRRLPMEPVWLDLAAGEGQYLAFIRPVYSEKPEICILQGVLIDWQRLRTTLEQDIADIFPNARIVPITSGDEIPPELVDSVMLSIPVRLETGETIEAVQTAQRGGLNLGLMLTWLVTIAALVAITYGAARYVSIVERRMRFVAAVTHELRTPLTTFQLYTDLLGGDAADDPERRREYIETLRGESERLARLVENVLAYSRMGARGPKLDRRRIMPGELLDAVRAETSEQCESANKQLVIDNDCGDDVAVETDSEFVVQILSNLVDNACKYSGGAEDRRIWLSTSEGPDHSVLFAVEDAGPGVTQSDRREVFRPFRRGRTAKAQELTGLGLGLALSRYWAECLGGRLTLRRGRQNGAHLARFELSLPCDTGAAQ